MTIYKYEIGSDDDVVFTPALIKKLKTTDTIPGDAAEINLNGPGDTEEIEAVYGKALKYYNIYSN